MPKLSITVRDYKGTKLAPPDVTLTIDEAQAAFDPAHQVFTTELAAGSYTCTVVPADSLGLVGRSQSVTLAERALKLDVYLGQPGMRFYSQNGVAIPFAPKPNLLVVESQTPLQPESDAQMRSVSAPVTHANHSHQVFEVDDPEATSHHLLKDASVFQAGHIVGGENYDQPHQLTYLSTNLIVSFRPEIGAANAEALVREAGDAMNIPIVRVSKLPFGADKLEIELDNASYQVLDLADHLLQDQRVTDAEPCLIRCATPHTLTRPNDPGFKQQDYLVPTHVTDAWALLQSLRPDAAYGSPDLALAIMDAATIFWKEGDQVVTHEDFVGAVSSGEPKVVAVWDPYDQAAYSVTGARFHGVGVAGIATALPDNQRDISGVAGNCRLISSRYSTKPVEVAKTFAWLFGEAVDGYPAPPAPSASVINNSWSYQDHTPLPSLLLQAFEYGVTQGRGGKGLPIVYSSGNDNHNIDDLPLFANPDLIVVGASSLDGKRTSFSNFGERVDVCVPSNFSGLYTLQPAKSGADTEVGGTSGAAPQVTGMIALALSLNPDLTLAQIVALLRATADHIDYPGDWVARDNSPVPNFNPYYGYGQAHAARLLRAAALTLPGQTGIGADDDIFARSAPLWDSPALTVSDQGVSVQVFNGGAQPASVTVKLFTLPPSLVATPDKLTLLGTVTIDAVPAQGVKQSAPIPLPASDAPFMILAQVVGDHPELDDLTLADNAGDYAALVRWSARIGWKQPAPISAQTFTLTTGGFPGVSVLEFDLTQAAPDAQVSVTLDAAVTALTPGQITPISGVIPADRLTSEAVIQHSFAANSPQANSIIAVRQFIDGYAVGQVQIAWTP